ncbi:hypothetical protein Q8G38_16095 [Halomonas venusta]|uniref:hypothetical protein n=1 Tax=Vreelandella venusta TaxID=44935 RepID=UPI00295F1733|nr:hypothetical protein [Halomonas venusta]MDW0360835.1 hypothetical protein [Halomonas venusta]
MLKQDFTIGPFTIAPMGAVGTHRQRFSVSYNHRYNAEIVTEAKTQRDVADAAGDAISQLRRHLKEDHECATLIRLTDGKGQTLSKFYADGVLPDMTPGLVDDRFDYWLKDESGKYSQAVTLGEFATLVEQHGLLKHSWIADLLPSDVLTTNVDEWRAPTPWEIRHIVGEGSFIGISGAKAAALVGVTARNFRKYTAQDGAKSRQNMSFAMWHLLLHRLAVQKIGVGE